MSRNQIFISYSHEDDFWLRRFQVHLKPLLRNQEVEAWDDTRIDPGADWQEEIDRALSLSKVAVLLVSSDFLASDFIVAEELPYLLDAAKSEQVKVLPVAVRPSAWISTPLRSKQFVNNPEKPLSDLGESERDKELVRICEKVTSYFAERAAIVPENLVESHSRSAEEGLKALVKLMDVPEVSGRVERFNTVFETVTAQIELLGYYKDLHDLLHTLQFQCYNYLMGLVRRARKDPTDADVWSDVVDHELLFQSVLERARNRSAHSSSKRAALPWIEKLSDDLEALFDAVQNHDADQIDATIRPVRKLLATEPSQINARLAVAAEALQLDKLIEALRKVLKTLNRANVSADTLEKFEHGVGAFEGLQASLNALIDSHNEFQLMDSVMRRIEASLSTDLTDLQESWEDLKDSVAAQYGGSEESWAKLLRDATEKLDAALEAREPELSEIRNHFLTFKTRAGNRFYKVDLSLKSLCDQLRRVDEPLRNVLGKIQLLDEE